MSDNEWRIQVTALLAEVKANQENLADKLDEYIRDSEKRLDDLEVSVNGRHDTPGLKEEVRNIKGKWALVYGAVVAGFSTVAHAAVASWFK